ncbi:tetratricopeptide repeat protein [Cupriavidus necator]|uniref:tetratricopeptide repeat protein n=1 Tax=Cupriavidus necator TaxID=106590 RepID=UPI003AF3B999
MKPNSNRICTSAGLVLAVLTSTLIASPYAEAETSFSPKGLYDAARSYEQSDPATAIRLYNDSAAAGYLPAQLLLAGLHRSGIAGVEKNCKRAIYWYELAEEQGSLEAIGGSSEYICRRDWRMLLPSVGGNLV